MHYIYLGITLFVSLTITLHVNALLERWINRWLGRRHAPRCDVCGVNVPEFPHVSFQDGLPKITQMCRPCALEAVELRKAAAKDE